jgi:hypothetical protein
MVRKWHSSILDVRNFRGADCDTERYLMVVKGRKILAGSKQPAQNFDVIRFNLRKLNELVVRKQCQFAISNGYAALENFSDRVWWNIKESIKTSAKESLGLQELKQHRPWFAEDCLGFF